MEYYSLSKELKGLYGKPLNELPETQCHYIKSKIMTCFNIKSWDMLSIEERYAASTLWDLLNAPAVLEDGTYREDLDRRIKIIQNTINEWKSKQALSISELDIRENRLTELRSQLDLLQFKFNDFDTGHLLQDTSLLDSKFGERKYIPFNQALKLLSHRLSATEAEMAAWIHFKENNDRLFAFTKGGNLTPPKRFDFDRREGDEGYISHMMSCWFLVDEISNFKPENRFVTGQQLIEYWSCQPRIKVKDFIKYRIDEGNLRDYQPIIECAVACNKGGYSLIETALFLWSDVADIDYEFFDEFPVDVNKLKRNIYPLNILPSIIEEARYIVEADLPSLKSSPLLQKNNNSKQENLIRSEILELEKIQEYISSLNDQLSIYNSYYQLEDISIPITVLDPIVGSVEWRTKIAKLAAEARHNKPGGSREKQNKIREIWLTGKYDNRDICAEEEYQALKMSFSSARKALRNTPDPS